MTTDVLILGAGGHAKVIADAVLSVQRNLIGFLDDRAELHGTRILGHLVLGSLCKWTQFSSASLIIGIGNNETRERIALQIEAKTSSLVWATIVHRSAIVSETAILGNGTAIMAGAVVNPDVMIGNHAIVNTGATIDHDCQIDDYAHVAPGANLAGNVRVGRRSLIGIGSSIVPGCRIGEDTTIGAGAAVISDVPPSVVAVGVPARWKSL